MTSPWIIASFAVCVLHCGAPGDQTWLDPPLDEPGLHIERRIEDTFAARFSTEDRVIELSSTSAAALTGDVTIGVGALRYDLHYDYAGRELVADGHGGAIDRVTQQALRLALDELAGQLGPADPSQPLHEQMLAASLTLLEESGGMPLGRMSFPLDPLEPDATSDGAALEKSLSNDSIRCIRPNTTYAVSFDVGGTQVVGAPITSNSSACNGQCGPSCTRLTPWVMWTLDCLEHDACCNATSDDSCWTPLGECGDEYGHAETDFLRGFDPFGKHCKG